ncbi:MAG: flagellar motor switch phosphatase FliY [Desulfitobacteriaceae bacterium]
MSNGMLSQEEIDALLRGTLEPEGTENGEASEMPATGGLPGDFSEMETDAIGEIANISMGTAATTLSQLLGKKVEITTPKVDVATSDQIRKDYPVPSVIVDVKYKAGIEGSNILILSQRDASVIVDLMMGGDGKSPSEELSELQISGVSEAMNQMMGSAATSMSTMFNAMVDITPPQLALNDLSVEGDGIRDFLAVGEELVRISFRMVVEAVMDSILVQVIPLSVAKGMVSKLMGVVQDAPTPSPQPAIHPAETPSYGTGVPASPTYEQTAASAAYAMAPPAYGMTPPASSGAAQGGYYPPPPNYQGAATSVQPAQFAPLAPGHQGAHSNNLSLILDVPLQISVELGRTKKTIKEILEMGPGSVIELERLAGEPVDMIVNGKLIAKCEVVVINETFGIRITDIVNPAERIKTLN